MPLGGGGTDLPWYYKKYGGFFISGAINKYMHIVVNRRFEPGIRVSYSQTEDVEDLQEIKHPSAREVLKMLDIHDRIEVVSVDDGEVILYWEVDPKQASKLVKLLRSDLASLDAEEFFDKWLDADAEDN